MKVNDPNLSAANSAALNSVSAEAAQAARTQAAKASDTNGTSRTGGGSRDDVHLSELVRSLRALAADSPERQAYVDQIERTYASGNYQVAAGATAGKIIDDALNYPRG